MDVQTTANKAVGRALEDAAAVSGGVVTENGVVGGAAADASPTDKVCTLGGTVNYQLSSVPVELEVYTVSRALSKRRCVTDVPCL